MAQTTPVGIGVIGAGVISQIYLKNLTTRFPGVRVVGIADIVPAAAQARADEFETLFSSSPIGLAITHSPTCKDMMLNPALTAMIGDALDAARTRTQGAAPTTHPVPGIYQQGRALELPADLPICEAALAGFEVIRTKIEAVGPHRDLPQSDEVAAKTPHSNYFEHHAKVTLPSAESEAEIARAFAELGAYLSRGAPRGDGVELRFVTLRSWGLGQASADARFDRVLALAAELGLPLRNRMREYTVYDSALEVDAGWMA